MGGSHVRQCCKLIINTGNYSAIHVEHEFQMAIPDGDKDNPQYAAFVKDAQAKVDKVVMEHQVGVRDKILKMLDDEAKK